MTDMGLRAEQLKPEIAQKKQMVVEYEQQIAVHPKHLDDPKKGRLCPNYSFRTVLCLGTLTVLPEVTL
jgi:hypothetical protein